MLLPEYVETSIRKLEAAGFAAYAVGGCVRDDLLGITPHDYDLCTDALPEQICECFAEFPQIHTGIQHGTVSVVFDKDAVEITTFRTEGAYRDNRHPDWVKFVSAIEEDLARRDYTINAIAWSPTRGYADPFGGRADLQAGILRAVGDPDVRYREDALRILRGMRFAARFRMALDPVTEDAMKRQSHLLENLARERVFSELCGFLPLADAGDLQRFAPLLCRVIPELEPMVGFDQHSPHHAYDVYVHTAYVLEAVSTDLTQRWAALLHDVGKVECFTRDETGRGHFHGHAHSGAVRADAILLRLKAPTRLREDVVWLIDHHMTRLIPDRKLLRRTLASCGWERTWHLLELQTADMGSKGTGEYEGNDSFDRVREELTALQQENGCYSLKDLAVDGGDLTALGYRGKDIGVTLNRLLEQVVDEQLPNEKEALLRALETGEGVT